MKKVSWSSRKEVVGSTKVVIVATFVLAVLLYGVDLVFIRLFSWLPMK
jgi:preprotein translocase SecE subunit